MGEKVFADSLNYHYMNAKKPVFLAIIKYVITHLLKHVAIVEYGLNFKGKNMTPLSMWGQIAKKFIYY
jgi:hypothetical protein